MSDRYNVEFSIDDSQVSLPRYSLDRSEKKMEWHWDSKTDLSWLQSLKEMVIEAPFVLVYEGRLRSDLCDFTKYHMVVSGDYGH